MTHTLSSDDQHLVAVAERDGSIAARVFERGDFSEEGFLLYGRLERLCARGWLRFVSWSGDATHDTGEVAAVFAPMAARAA